MKKHNFLACSIVWTVYSIKYFLMSVITILAIWILVAPFIPLIWSLANQCGDIPVNVFACFSVTLGIIFWVFLFLFWLLEKNGLKNILKIWKWAKKNC